MMTNDELVEAILKAKPRELRWYQKLCRFLWSLFR